MHKEVFKQLLFVEEDQLILGVEQVFQLGLLKGEKRLFDSPVFFSLALESLNISRALVMLIPTPKPRVVAEPIFIFIEKAAGTR